MLECLYMEMLSAVQVDKQHGVNEQQEYLAPWKSLECVLEECRVQRAPHPHFIHNTDVTAHVLPETSRGLPLFCSSLGERTCSNGSLLLCPGLPFQGFS